MTVNVGKEEAYPQPPVACIKEDGQNQEELSQATQQREDEYPVDLCTKSPDRFGQEEGNLLDDIQQEARQVISKLNDGTTHSARHLEQDLRQERVFATKCQKTRREQPMERRRSDRWSSTWRESDGKESSTPRRRVARAGCTSWVC